MAEVYWIFIYWSCYIGGHCWAKLLTSKDIEKFENAGLSFLTPMIANTINQASVEPLLSVVSQWPMSDSNTYIYAVKTNDWKVVSLGLSAKIYILL